MKKYLLIAVGMTVVAGCGKKKPEGPDAFMQAYSAAGEIEAEDPEAGADSLYSLYKNNPNYNDEERLRECLFISGNWVYAAVGQTEDTLEQRRLMAKAVPRYEEFIDKYPNSPKIGQVYKDVTYCLFMLKQYRECVDISNRWIADPMGSTSEYLPYAYKYAGRSYTYLDKKDSAIIYLKEAYKLFDAQAFLAEAKAMREDLDKLGVKKIY